MSTTVTPRESTTKQTANRSTWTVKNVTLKLHLYLGLASAIFLVILGVTGAIIAFEADVDHWVHPSLWHAKPTGPALPEAQLIQNAEQRFAPAKVRQVVMPRSPGLAQVMLLAAPGKAADFRNGLQVFVNPYDGAILGSRTEMPRIQKIFGAIHQFHLRIAMGEAGKLIVSIAGLILLFEVILGLILWWRLKRTSIHWKGSGYRVFFDLHNAIGIYSAVFLLLAALTGVVIGFDFIEPVVFKVTHSEPMLQRRPVQSTVVPGATPISIDQAIAIAQRALPGATLATLQPPATPKAAYNIGMRVPEETSEAVHSSVAVDQYGGQVLRLQNFSTESLGYRVIRFNRSLHTGDVLGMPTHILMSLSSLVLVVMVITGVMIWWKKLAI